MRRLVTVFAALAVLIAACGGEQADPSVPSPSAEPVAASGHPALTVTYDGSDCVYEGPDRLITGPVDITFVNESDSDVGLDFRRLREGVTYEEFTAAVAPGLPAPHHLAKSVEWLSRDGRGLPNRGELTATVFVSESEHALVCVIQDRRGDPEGFSHAGSIPVTVAG